MCWCISTPVAIILDLYISVLCVYMGYTCPVRRSSAIRVLSKRWCVHSLLNQGCSCFFNRQSMLIWVSSMCWCMSTPIVIILDLCISVLYYCSASHICIWYRISVGSLACFYVGLSHHQALFWDGWVNLDWLIDWLIDTLGEFLNKGRSKSGILW